MSGSNCFFLTYIQVSQEAGKVVWYSYLFKNFWQFVVIHTVKGFGILNEADVFLEFSCFFYDPTDVDNLISGSSAFSTSSWNNWKFLVHELLKPSWENFEHYFASVRRVQLCSGLNILWLCLSRFQFFLLLFPKPKALMKSGRDEPGKVSLVPPSQSAVSF